MKKLNSLFHLPAIGSCRRLVQAGCVIILLILFLFIKPVFAQKQYEDYQYQYEKYHEYEQTYNEARNKYVTYQTFNSENDYLTAGKQLLLSRALVTRTYLQYLQSEIRQAPNILADTRTNLILTLDSQINWLKTNETDIQALDKPTVDDLLQLSTRIEANVGQYYQTSYRVMTNIILGNARSLQQESLAINLLLSDRIAKGGYAKDTQTLNLWLETIKEKLYTSQQYLAQAEYYSSLIDSGKVENIQDSFIKMKQSLENIRSVLDQAIQAQKELYKEVEK